MASQDKGIYVEKDFGKVTVRIGIAMDAQGITRNRMSTLTGIKYDIITKYYKGESIDRVDLVTLAKFCYVLRCSVQDLMEYLPPNEP